MHSGHQACECCREYSIYHGYYIYNGDARFCDYTNDWYFSEELVDLYDDSECFEDYDKLKKSENGDYFIEGDSEFIQPEGSTDWYHESDSEVEEVDGIWYLINSEVYKNLQEC